MSETYTLFNTQHNCIQFLSVYLIIIIAIILIITNMYACIVIVPKNKDILHYTF